MTESELNDLERTIAAAERERKPAVTLATWQARELLSETSKLVAEIDNLRTIQEEQDQLDEEDCEDAVRGPEKGTP